MVSINTLHALESKLMSNQIISKEAEAGVFACFGPTTPLIAIFVSSSLSRGSPWWATTGAAPWCGTWLSFSRRGSGREHTHPVLSTSTLAAELKCVFCCRHYRAVASLNTPLFRVDPSVSMEEKVKEMPIFDYQIYFQKPVSLPAARLRAHTGDTPQSQL